MSDKEPDATPPRADDDRPAGEPAADSLAEAEELDDAESDDDSDEGADAEEAESGDDSDEAADAEDAESDEDSDEDEDAESDEDEDADEPAPRQVRRKTAKAPVKKAKATPKRREKEKAGSAHQRTTPAMFVRESVAELRKVVWPSGDQLRQYFVVVLTFVLFIILYVGLLDLVLGWGLLKLFG